MENQRKPYVTSPASKKEPKGLITAPLDIIVSHTATDGHREKAANH